MERARAAMVEAIEAQLGDNAAARAVVDAYADLLLQWSPPTIDADRVSSLVVYAFGNRVAADGSLQPGPVNEALAVLTRQFVAGRGLPVFAQWEVADLLAVAGVPDVVSIGPDLDASGATVYLSTAGVADKAVRLAGELGIPLGTVGVIAFRDHAVRCVTTSARAGMDAAVPAGLELPMTYDPESGQPWTRDRVTYVVTDVAGRMA